MAFLKKAYAAVTHRGFSPENWGNFIGQNRSNLANGPYRTASGSPNLVAQASDILKEEFNPNNYLLTHATIVASVDTEDVQNVKLGSISEYGRQINRKWANYRVIPQCDIYVNNNNDSWDRPVLLKSYRTFIGAHNFCFAPGTHVLLADGTYRPIESVEVGDEVTTHEGRARKVTHKFVRDFKGDVQEIYVDKYKKPILATGNHPFRAIDVEAPPLGTYSGSTVASQARYRRDEIVKFLRGDRSAFDTTRRVLPRLVSLLQQEGPLTESEIFERGLSVSGSRKALRRETNFFTRRPMTEEERSRRQARARRAHVWVLRQDAPLHLVQPIVAHKDWVAAERLQVGDFLLGPERPVGVESREDEATLLGYYLAEGCLVGTPEHPQGFALNFGPHEMSLAEHAQEIARRMFPGPSCNINPTQTSLRLNVYSAEAGEWAFKMGGHLAPHKRVDPQVYAWDRESLLRLLGAWMAGDGNVHKETFRLRGTSTSEMLAHQMQRIAEIAGIKSCVVFERRRIGEVQSQVTMVVGGAPKTYEVINRHHAWTVIVSKDSVHEIATRSRRWGAGLCRVRKAVPKQDDVAWWGDCRVHRVADVRTTPYSGKVYNLEVEEDHSYVVDHGVAVHNCEHVQVEELSKGRIIDAVARDIGDSVYTDILIATNRKHASLIKDIESGKMGTLSMGCSVTETQCTKCGNVAADETEMCEHVRYAKGNYEFDSQGRKYRIAELCGHHTLDPTGGVTFIEASWVAVPAFQGAVMRNILNPEQVSSGAHDKVRAILASPPPEWTNEGEMEKAARLQTPTVNPPVDVSDEQRIRSEFTRLGQFPPMPGMEGGEPGAEEAKDPLEELEDKLEKSILDRVRKRIEKKLRGEEEEADTDTGELAVSTNENINHQAAMKRRAALVNGAEAIIRIARSDIELLDGLARLHESHGIKISRALYRAVLRAGSTDGQPSLEKYLSRCAEVLGRKPTTGEAKTMVRLGRILSLRKKTRF